MKSKKVIIVVVVFLFGIGAYLLHESYYRKRRSEAEYYSGTPELIKIGPMGLPYVPFVAVLANPLYYDGKWVVIRGYSRIYKDGDCYLWGNKSDYWNGYPTQSFIKWYFERDIYEMGTHKILLPKLSVHNGKFVSLVAKVSATPIMNGGIEVQLTNVAVFVGGHYVNPARLPANRFW
jgi:hypothetical protein